MKEIEVGGIRSKFLMKNRKKNWSLVVELAAVGIQTDGSDELHRRRKVEIKFQRAGPWWNWERMEIDD